MKTIVIEGWVARDIREGALTYIYDIQPVLCDDCEVYECGETSGMMEIKNDFNLLPGECKPVTITIETKE